MPGEDEIRFRGRRAGLVLISLQIIFQVHSSRVQSLYNLSSPFNLQLFFFFLASTPGQPNRNYYSPDTHDEHPCLRRQTLHFHRFRPHPQTRVVLGAITPSLRRRARLELVQGKRSQKRRRSSSCGTTTRLSTRTGSVVSGLWERRAHCTGKAPCPPGTIVVSTFSLITSNSIVCLQSTPAMVDPSFSLYLYNFTFGS